jgi:hypothetical protein
MTLIGSKLMRNSSSKSPLVSFQLPLTTRDEEVASDKNHQITLNRLTVVRVLGLIAVILVLASVAGQCTKYLSRNESVYGLIGLFDIDGEASIPSYFSASLLMLAAYLLSIISILKRKSRAPFALQWTILAFTFLYLAVDEAAGIHELLMKPTEELLGAHLTTGIFYFAWVIPGMAVTVLFALSFLVFFLYLPTPVRSFVLVAAILYIGGAIGMELIGGWYIEYREVDLTFNMIATVEESLEMAGAIVFIHALMTYIEANYREVRFRFEHSTETAKPSRLN